MIIGITKADYKKGLKTEFHFIKILEKSIVQGASVNMVPPGKKFRILK